jgi:hypothetical protein
VIVSRSTEAAGSSMRRDARDSARLMWCLPADGAPPTNVSDRVVSSERYAAHSAHIFRPAGIAATGRPTQLIRLLPNQVAEPRVVAGHDLEQCLRHEPGGQALQQPEWH